MFYESFLAFHIYTPINPRKNKYERLLSKLK
jgi:hypothetical protein